MGRLDDIAKRNQKANIIDGPLMHGVSTVVTHGDKPSEPVAPFTLPSQRKSSTSRWKILLAFLFVLALVLVGALVRPFKT